MKITEWNSEHMIFSDGSIYTYDHEQDCCEFNYIDFTVLDVMYHDEEFDSVFFEEVDCGILMHLVNEAHDTVAKIYLPCYSDQNGYYSRDVCLMKNDEYVVRCCEGELIY